MRITAALYSETEAISSCRNQALLTAATLCRFVHSPQKNEAARGGLKRVPG